MESGGQNPVPGAKSESPSVEDTVMVPQSPGDAGRLSNTTSASGVGVEVSNKYS